MSADRKQRDRILSLLIQARGGWISLPQIAECAAQYNARIFELRQLGFHIENRTEMHGGVRHSWFRLVSSTAAPQSEAPRVLQAEGDGVLFAPDPARAQSVALAYETGRRGAR